MRLTTIRITPDRTTAARIDKKHFTPLPHPDVGALIASGTDWPRRAAAHTGERLPLPSATTEVPPLTLGRVVCTGPNYPTRLKERDRQHPAAPSMSLARPHAVAGARTSVPLPETSSRGMAWGVELGVVVSHRAHRVPATEALHHVAGYVLATYLYALGDPAKQDGPDGLRPLLLLGPDLVTPDHLPIGGRGLTLTATLDGRPVQNANTSDLHFDVATLLARASDLTPLEPGDLITTGTPGGTLAHPLGPSRSLQVAIKGLGDIDCLVTDA
ncbi:fumarylacetoacetate hydrolase family protein [Streptomyces sp. NPDC004330]|uniref:fumarylacetoacetate hydrolase family protein n=1 Tax=Streptomyces sp. NPDC004330 TaxID=3364700 RepID=UPI0036C0E8A1